MGIGISDSCYGSEIPILLKAVFLGVIYCGRIHAV